MNINYIILAHKEPLQVRRLVERLSTSTTYFYIHVDLNADIAPFEHALKDVPHVQLLPLHNRAASVWGSPGIVMATLKALKEISRQEEEGYTILISGQCYPIKSNDSIAAYFKKYNGYNFIQGFDLPDDTWSNSNVRMHHYAFFLSSKKGDFITVPSFLDLEAKALFNGRNVRKYLKLLLYFPLQFLILFKRRRLPLPLHPVGGMQWWALPNETIRYIVRYLEEHPAYVKYHSRTLYSDEIFFQTLVYNLFSKIKQPVMFVNWVSEEARSSPETLTAADLSILKDRPELFARKFDIATDEHILDLIDHHLVETDTPEVKKEALNL